MKNASKLLFGLGVAATLGVATIAYIAGKDRSKTAKGMMDDGRDFVRDSKDAIEDGMEFTLNNETEEQKNARHVLKSIQRATKDVGQNVKNGIDDVSENIHNVADKIANKIKNES